MKRTTYYLFASAIALTTALPAFAQVTDQPPAAPAEAEQAAAPTRDVVVITANKREETVQDIAVAVTALTAEAKEQLGVISVTDLTNVTPGLSYTPGNERITLRGIGRLTNSFGADPGVANYNDGIYTPFAVMAGKDPQLIQRVEVLRGPQGTLYGRNAIGGAINTISKRPSDEFTADFKLGVGSYDYRNIVAAVSGPITDSLRYRVAAQREQRNGVDFNYGTGNDEGWEIDDYYYEGQLEGEIGDRFSWWLKVADSGYDKAGPPGGRTASFSTAPFLGTFNPSGNVNPNPAFAYTNPLVTGYTQTGNRTDNPFATNGEHAYNSNYASTAKLDQYDEAIFEAVYETDWFDIKYTGGYTFYDYSLYTDADGTPLQSVTYLSNAGGIPSPTGTARTIYPNVLNLYGESRSIFSNEINLISTTDGPLTWIVGAYQYQENSEQPGQVQTLDFEPLADRYYNPGTGAFINNPDRYLQYFGNTSLFNAYGLYGQGDYTLNDQLKFTFGLRYSKDIKESKEEGFLACYILCSALGLPAYSNITATQYATAFAASPGAYFDERGFAIRRLKGDWEAVTGTAGIEYRPWDDTLTFLKYSRGYKAGGFNNLGFGASPYTDPEFVDSYEAGWKQTWVDFGLTTNAALFFYKYSDAQAPLSEVTTVGNTQTSTTRFVNLPEVETKGFELEANWNPIDPLNIGFTYAYLDAEVTESGTYADPTRAPTDPLRSRSVVGNTLAQSPENKISANVTYRFDMEDGSYLLPTISYSWRDKFYDSFFNNSAELSPSYENVDARLNWYSPNETFSITAWVRNVFDEEQNTSISANNYRPEDAGRYQTFAFTPPRMVGIDLKFHFE
jgi:iron complex outermembrane receptor protein